MDNKELHVSDADNPADVERLIRHIAQRLVGKESEFPELSQAEISKHDMLIISDVLTRAATRQFGDAASSLQFEAELITLFASFGITDDHRT